MSQSKAPAEASPLSRLIYYSRNRIAGSRAEVAAEVDAILAASHRNNPGLGVTGALIFNSGVFAQVLEGPRAGIEAAFERIQRDPRHGEVHVLALEDIARRSFPSWSMGFVGRSLQGRDLFGHVGATSGFEAGQLDGERIFTIIKTIALEEELTA
jgi:Sensors of blue-light using FAD